MADTRGLFETGGEEKKLKLTSPFNIQGSAKTPNYECFSVEDENYEIGGSQTLQPHLETWRPYAVALCTISLLCTLGLAIATFIYAAGAGNDALFGFGATCVLDFLSTVFVLWRFWPTRMQFSKARELELERIASLRIAILFVVAFVAIFIKCVYRLVKRLNPSENYNILIVAYCSLGVCLVLAVAKISLAKRMLSSCLYSDGMNSLAGAFIATGVIVSWYVYKTHTSVWYLSSAIGLAVAFGLLAMGVTSTLNLTKARPRMLTGMLRRNV